MSLSEKPRQMSAVGSDLQHAANCVMIANNLHTQRETLDTQITDARRNANEYDQVTNNLLNKINTVLLAEK